MQAGKGLVLPKRALERLAEVVAEKNGGDAPFIMSVRVDDTDLCIRDFAAYLALIDGAWGRTSLSGYRQYARAPQELLHITEVRHGSTQLLIALPDLSEIGIWRTLILYLIARIGPSLLKGEAAKNWAEAARAASETYRIWNPLTPTENAPSVEVTSRAEPIAQKLQINAAQRRELNDLLEADEYFTSLNTRHRRIVVRALLSILGAERHRLAAVHRFVSKSLLSVTLRRRD